MYVCVVYVHVCVVHVFVVHVCVMHVCVVYMHVFGVCTESWGRLAIATFCGLPVSISIGM